MKPDEVEFAYAGYRSQNGKSTPPVALNKLPKKEEMKHTPVVRKRYAFVSKPFTIRSTITVTTPNSAERVKIDPKDEKKDSSTNVEWDSPLPKIEHLTIGTVCYLSSTIVITIIGTNRMLVQENRKRQIKGGGFSEDERS